MMSSEVRVSKAASVSLKEPLILHSDIDKPLEDESTVLANQVYATTAPKIMLEVLTARTTAILFVVLYLVFVIGFSLDVRSTVVGFNSFNRELSANSCKQANISSYSGFDNGCTYGHTEHSASWAGIVTNLKNVISVELKVSITNFTSIVQNNTVIPIQEAYREQLFPVAEYNITVYCCYQEHGCGNHFSSDVQVDEEAWYLMLEDTTNVITLEPNQYNSKEESYSYILVGYTFQNQEALPMRGKVKSYLLLVNFQQHAESADMYVQPAEGSNIEYIFNVVTRPEQEFAFIITAGLLLGTVVLLVTYVNALFKYQKGAWLPEQKWIIWYLILIIIYQNPVFCVIVWLSNANTDSIFTSYLLDAFAQSALFVIWLLFSDGLKRKVASSRIAFYGPKIVFGGMIMLFQYVVLTMQFCSLDPQNTSRTPLEAVQQWQQSTKITFCIFSCLFLSALILWALWWFYSLYWTGKILEKLPYMSTRYLQLSYQFFVTQATLVTLYYVFQYLIVIYFVFRNDKSAPSDTEGMLETVTDNINILFRQQTQLFGKLLFLTFYAFILAFLFLPSDVMTSNKAFRSLASTFVISTEEMKIVVKSRKKMIRNIKHSTVLYDMNLITGTKAEVFCIDISLVMLNISYEAYYDPPGCDTLSGYGLMDIEQYGYLIVDYIYHEELDMFCFVARHALTNNIVVAFRGSSSKVHWKHNFNFKQKELDLVHMPLTDMDVTDGLQEYVDQYSELLDDASDDEDDEEARSIGGSLGSAPQSFHQDRDSSGKILSGRSVSGASSGIGGSGKGVGVGESRKSLISTVRGGASRVRKGVNQVAATVGGVTHTAVDGATGLLKSAAYVTPGLRKQVAPFVHSGFYEGYEGTRAFVHRVLRRELTESPTANVYFTGHSLGGALATFAALDVQMHTLPRVNAWLRLSRIRTNLGLQNKDVTPPVSTADGVDATTMYRPSSKESQQQELSGNQDSMQDTLPRPTIVKDYRANLHNIKEVKVTMYNFGSPRVGNAVFAQQYNDLLPDSFRVAVDGDVVTGIPVGSYKHVGTNVMVDALGAGSIIIDPSYVEKRLRTRTKAHVSVHSLIIYRQGLEGVKAAAQYMQDHARQRNTDTSMDAFDSVKLAINAGPLNIWTLLGGSADTHPRSSTVSAARPSASSGMDDVESVGAINAGRLSFATTGSNKQPEDSILLQQIETSVPLNQVNPLAHRKSFHGNDLSKELDKDARHLQHDNEIHQQLFASIRQHEEAKKANQLTPMMKRSIKIFQFQRKPAENSASTSTSSNNAADQLSYQVATSNSSSKKSESGLVNPMYSRAKSDDVKIM